MSAASRLTEQFLGRKKSLGIKPGARVADSWLSLSLGDSQAIVAEIDNYLQIHAQAQAVRSNTTGQSVLSERGLHHEVANLRIGLHTRLEALERFCASFRVEPRRSLHPTDKEGLDALAAAAYRIRAALEAGVALGSTPEDDGLLDLTVKQDENVGSATIQEGEYLLRHRGSDGLLAVLTDWNQEARHASCMSMPEIQEQGALHRWKLQQTSNGRWRVTSANQLALVGLDQGREVGFEEDLDGQKTWTVAAHPSRPGCVWLGASGPAGYHLGASADGALQMNKGLTDFMLDA